LVRSKTTAGGNALHRSAIDASRRVAHVRHGEGHGGFVPNYDELLPTDLFPARFPTCSSTVHWHRVGMHQPPPHNLGEVIDGICAQIDRPALQSELMKFIKGRTSYWWLHLRSRRHQELFHDGQGSIKLRVDWSEEMKGNRDNSSSPRSRLTSIAPPRRTDCRAGQRQGHHGNLRDAQ